VTKKYFFLLAILIFGNTQKGICAIFIVNNLADAGIGSLREAITLSNNNGSGETDFINFSIPGSLATDKTITLHSPLPQITTSLVIDGSSQPGAAISVNGAKIILQAAGPFTDATGNILSRTDCFFVKSGAAIFELYGMIIRNFYSVQPDGRFSTGTGVFVDDAGNRLVIGSPGKGNVFYDNGGGLEVQGISACIIKSNLIGVKENGLDFQSYPQLGVGIAPGVSCVFGGETAAEGNIGFGSFNFGNLYDNATLTLRNNIFNANSTYHRTSNAEAMMKIQQFRVYVFSQLQPNSIHPPVVLIDHNILGCNLTVAKCNGLDLNIASNSFGTSPDRSAILPVYNSAITIQQTTGRILIGGAATELGNVFTNEIASSGTTDQHAVVETSASSSTELSHNSFYCNDNPPFLYLDKGVNDKPISVSVDALTASTIAGSSKSGSRIELYYEDLECTGCQPKRYIASVITGPDGKWNYAAPLEPGYGVLASATLNQISSEFSNTVIYPGKAVIHDVTCHNNGSITGLTIANSDKLQWIDETGKVVGTGPALTNVQAGNYYLKASQFSCTVNSPVFVVKTAPPLAIVSEAEQIMNDQCGQQVGYLKGLNVSGGTPPYKYLWTDGSGNNVSTSLDLINAKAGTYTLHVTDADLCSEPTATYSLNNDVVNIPPPSANNINACGTTANIKVNNPMTGYVYRLYKSLTAPLPVAENSKGIFPIALDGDQTFYLTQANGYCESSRVKLQVTLGPHPIVVPNIFTPNGDGINDYWKLNGIENYPESLVQVFNRNGQKVFESRANSRTFDGNYNGNILPVGTYYFIVTLSLGCDILSGSLTLIR